MIFDPEDIDKDGNARYGYMLNHNQMGLDLNSLVDAIELKPINEAYWAQKVGVTKVDFAEFDRVPIPFRSSIKLLRTLYWVPKDVHQKFMTVFSKTGIPTEHFDDLLLVVHYQELYQLNFRSSEIDHAAAIKEMLAFVDTIQNEIFQPSKLQITGKSQTKLHPKEFSKERTFTFSEQNVLKLLLLEFKQWVNNSKSYDTLFTRYEPVLDSARRPKEVKDEKRYSVFNWLYDYLMDHDLANVPHQACLMVGLLLSVYPDLIPAYPHTKHELTEEDREKWYKKEVANYVRNLLKRIRP
jgi:hypothetical protein